MIAVIFEVMPAPGRKQEYLDLAAALRLGSGPIMPCVCATYGRPRAVAM